MKNNWQIKKLGEACEIVNGGTPKTGVLKYWDGDILWITPKDMGRLKEIYAEETERKITQAGLEESSAKIIPPNSIILSTRAPIGHLAINTKEISTNQGCKGLIPNKNLDTKFLYYFLEDSVELLNSLGSGTTFKELSGSKLKEVEMPFPTLIDQKRIVKILDEVFVGVGKAKENAERNLQNSRELFESYLQEVFEYPEKGWQEKTLGEICSIKHGFAFKSQYFTHRGDYVLLTPGNFYECGGYKDRGIKQKYYNGPLPADFILSENNLLVAMTEQAPGLLGSPILIPESKKFLHNQRLGLITSLGDLSWDTRFLFHFFNTKRVRDEIYASATGVKVRHTSPIKIQSITISLPPLPEQKAIVKKLDALSEQTKKLEGIYKQKLANLEELKKSVLKKAFAGEL